MFKIILPKINIKVERWKYNKNYKIYVSTFGNFKDENKKDIKILINSGGYCSIATKNGIKTAHRLVLETFKPVRDMENLTVDHLNHNKRDNSISNLEWVTKEINLERANQDLIKLDLEKSKIKAGQLIFNNIEDAVKWVIDSTGVKSNNPDPDKIKRKIQKAIFKNDCYCSRKWKQII